MFLAAYRNRDKTEMSKLTDIRNLIGKGEKSIKCPFCGLISEVISRDTLNEYVGIRCNNCATYYIGFLSSEGSRIENKIKDGNVDVVEQIARCGGEKWFAFATKYCSFVNPGEYPIYDSLVTKPLVEFNKQNTFTDEKLDFERIRQECNYGKYKGIVTAFRDKYCEGREYKDIDKFLWIVGKNM